MRLQRVIGFALFSAALGCHPAAHGEVAPAYAVDFPGGWARAIPGAQKTIISLPAELDVRLARGAAEEPEWLFRLKTIEGNVSDECYAVRGGASPVARRVATAECQGAPETKSTVAVATPAAAHGFQGVLYENRQYPMSGRVLGKALLSSTRRWLAVVSDTPAEEPRSRSNPMPALGGGEPSKGELFLDLYDTGTGVRKASARSQFAGFGPRILFEQAFWVQDSAFVMPLNMLADRCFLIAPELR